MKRLNKFLTERKGEKAHREAEAMGLKYKGFGYWVDPSTGKVTHKTEGDQLVKVEPDVETDKWEGGGDASAGGRPGPAGSNAMGMPNMGGLGMQQTVPGAGVGQAPEPGLETIQARLSWDPGPDGDTCVDSANPKPDVPDDTFVGKTNYYQWTAGPDGTNYLNMSFDTFMQSVTPDMPTPQVEEASYADDSARKPAPKERQDKIPGLGSFETLGGEKASSRIKQIIQPGREPEGRTNIDARAALDQLPGGLREKQVRSLLSLKNKSRDYPEQDKWDAEQGKRAAAWREAIKLPAKAKDALAVQQMNDGLGGLVSDPFFDLDQYDDDDFMEGGAFGQVLVDGDKIIKKGSIGPDEMKALFAMRDNAAFPSLINGKFTTPFKHQSSYRNNPIGADDEKRAEGESGYWDPDDQSEWEDKFPTAEGIYAMSRAKGGEAFDMFENMDEETKLKSIKNFWRARAQLHMAGFSHNDMHGGNIFLDEEGNPTIIDLGLAKDNPVSALMEALGGFDYENQEDYQLSHYFAGASLPDDMRETMDQRRSELEDLLMEEISDNPADYDDWDDDQEYSPTKTGLEQTLGDIMRGGIRLKQEDMDHYAEQFPMLKDKEKVKGLIKNLYRGLTDSELANRMSKAFDKRAADNRLVRIANQMRKERGSKPISVRNRDIVDPEHMDFDD